MDDVGHGDAAERRIGLLPRHQFGFAQHGKPGKVRLSRNMRRCIRRQTGRRRSRDPRDLVAQCRVLRSAPGCGAAGFQIVVEWRHRPLPSGAACPRHGHLAAPDTAKIGPDRVDIQ